MTGRQAANGDGVAADLAIRLLGPLEVLRKGCAVELPASRKTRAILGYVLLATRPVSRSQLCSLFFDVPDDPRAALRWSLSKLRALVDDVDLARLVAERDTLRFDVRGAHVDVHDLRQAADGDLALRDTTELERLLRQLGGALLADAELPDRAEYSAWLVAARADFQAIERRLLDELLRRLDDTPERILPLWQRRIALDPADEAAHAGLAESLLRLGLRAEAEAAVASAERALHREGLRPTPRLRAALTSKTAGAYAMGPRHSTGGAARGGLPTVAVLPFADLSRDPLPAYLAEGLVEGIVHDLAKFRSLSVLSRMATMRFRGRVEDPVQVGTQLGADVLVGGSLIATDQSVKIRWSVAETRTGRLIASGDLERARDDPAGLSSEVATQIAVSVEPHAQAEALERANQKPAVSKAAYDYYLQGLYGGFATPANADYALATRCFRKALEADPGFAPAAAFLPWAAACANLVGSAEEMRELEQLARRAVRPARDDARAQAVAGASIVFLAADFETGQAAAERALRLNPCDHFVWFWAGWIHLAAGEFERPLECFSRAEQLDPTGIATVGSRTLRAMLYFFHGDLDRAEHSARQALEDTPGNFWNWTIATAIAAERGEKAQCAERLARVLEFAPDGLASPLLAVMPYRQAAHRDRLVTALRRAGLHG